MNSGNESVVLFHGQQKITPQHLERLACIYIRQSSPGQVLHNKESQVNQRQLGQRAELLGWPRGRIRVIDNDLGLSGRDSTCREGFKELVAEVSLAHVGIIFSYEVSRLARNNSDWYHLLDTAALYGTLIADYDGIYDPRLYNDRLLLGLKGTMSEAELHLLRLRLREGRMRQVERGEYRQHLPTGLVRLRDGAVVKDPDDQVRHIVELVFAKFRELGSCWQVVLYMRRAGILLPRRQTRGPDVDEVSWKPAAQHAIYYILTNPAYAGAFAYGRTQQIVIPKPDSSTRTRVVRKPMAEWTHLAMDVYPAYISWEEYLVNQERLHQNMARFTARDEGAQGAPREGEALLQGIAVCGDCGYRMVVVYKKVHYYMCQDLPHRFGESPKVFLNGPAIDEAVVEAYFEVLQPAQLDTLEAVLSQQEAERSRLKQQWKERLQRAEYEAHLARRRYEAVDPDNRLVAAELEHRWDEKLRQLYETQEAYTRFLATQDESAGISPEMREQFQHLSDRLPSLWHSGQVTNAQKKELLRCLISHVIVKRREPGRVDLKIVWVSGHYSVKEVWQPTRWLRDLPNYDEMVERIEVLWRESLTDTQIAARLTEEGFRSAQSKSVTPATVGKLRLKYGWRCPPSRYCPDLEMEGYVTVAQLAARLGTYRQWIYDQIHSERIDPSNVIQHPKYNAFLIREDPDLIEQFQQQL
jgi:DNA invertase Pin-like site-specific DNA recombinase